MYGGGPNLGPPPAIQSLVELPRDPLGPHTELDRRAKSSESCILGLMVHARSVTPSSSPPDSRPMRSARNRGGGCKHRPLLRSDRLAIPDTERVAEGGRKMPPNLEPKWPRIEGISNSSSSSGKRSGSSNSSRIHPSHTARGDSGPMLMPQQAVLHHIWS